MKSESPGSKPKWWNTGFADDRERVEHLLGLYETLAEPLMAGLNTPVRRRRRVA